MSVHYPSRSWGDPRKLASRLNKRITIQQVAETPDAAGGFVRAWVDVVTVWAEIIPLRQGGERFFAGRLQSSATHRFIIRYRSGLDASMRILFAARPFAIRQITNMGEAGVLLEIEAEEGVAT